MMLIREPIASATKNVPALRTSNNRYYARNSMRSGRQMWVAGAAVLLLTMAIFTVNAELSMRHNDEPPRTHSVGDNLEQVSAGPYHPYGVYAFYLQRIIL